MSEKRGTFYITTPIYYVNDKPHIGHTYTTVVADVLARYHRLKGDETFFLTGTDENAQKNVDAAKKLKKDTREYVNEMAALWRETWLTLGISFDRFIRTTSAEHIKASKEFFNRVYERGDIYSGDYEGLYCVGCEEFKVESDLTDEGLCPEHKKKPERIKEKNYFFKLTAYRDRLLKHIEEHPDFIFPEKRRNEVVNYIRDFMTDVSISRQSMEWGIRLPIDEEHAMYVWFDALLNYFSGIGYAQDEVKFNKFWPVDVQLVGKGIIKFHCALWPAMLMSAGYELPKTFFAHGHFTVNGEKMGKSLNNAIDPIELSREYPFDAVRYFLLREIPFGEDGDFSLERLKLRYNTELANDLGNLVQRTLTMVEKYIGGIIDPSISHTAELSHESISSHIEQFKFDAALQIIWSAISWANKLIEDEKPWELAKTGNSEQITKVLSMVVSLISDIAREIEPLLPDTSKKIRELLSQEKLCAPETPLFPRKE